MIICNEIFLNTVANINKKRQQMHIHLLRPGKLVQPYIIVKRPTKTYVKKFIKKFHYTGHTETCNQEICNILV